jgi:oligopeptide transport system substrate-binding protein
MCWLKRAKTDALTGILASLLKLMKSVCLSALCLLSFAQAEQPESADCHIVTSIHISEFDLVFSPFDMGFSPINFIGDMTFLTLFDLNGAGGIEPRFAKHWESENNKLVIELDDRCRWSDGAKITARDMVDGIRLMFTNADSYVAGRALFKFGIEVLNGTMPLSNLGVRVVGDNHIEIEYVGAQKLMLNALAQPFYTPVPNHLLDAGEVKWPTQELLPITSGVYIGKHLSSADNRLMLSKNPYYCSHLPIAISTAEILTNISDRASVREFIFKKLDAISRVTSRFMQTLVNRSKSDDSYTIGAHSVLDNKTVYYLFINQLLPELTDSRVKSAIRLAIDHDLYLSSAMLGRLAKRLSSYTPNYERYNPPAYDYGSSDYQQRIEQAKALMRSAGYSDENPLLLDLPVRQNHYLKQMAEALGGMLSQVYIKPVYRNAGEGSDYYYEMDKGNFGAGFFIWVGDFPDPSNFLAGILAKRFIDEKVHARLKQKLIDSNHAVNSEESYRLLAELESDLAELGHVIPLYIINRGWAVRKPYQFGGLDTLTVRNIQSPECLEKALAN